jgi:hypothetical protein
MGNGMRQVISPYPREPAQIFAPVGSVHKKGSPEGATQSGCFCGLRSYDVKRPALRSDNPKLILGVYPHPMGSKRHSIHRRIHHLV